MWPWKSKRRPLLLGRTDRFAEFQKHVEAQIDREEIAGMMSLDIIRTLQKESLKVAADATALWYWADEIRKRLA